MPREMSRDNERELWKNRLDRKVVAGLAAEFSRACKRFDRERFVAAVVTDEFLALELKDRVNMIARRLHGFLPDDYRRAIDILIEVAPRVGGFENWALTAYVELFGLDHFDDSVRAMKALTPHGSAEFAIRPYMIAHTDRMLPVLHEWAEDSNEHVRRLAAEGSRPRGVWVAHIESFKQDPSPVLALLEKLKKDPSLYVRKAVANNLNDISKEHPDTVIATAQRWKQDRNPHTDWIVRHGCRSLIKHGDPRVFPLFGFTARPKLTCTAVKASQKTVAIGSDIKFSFSLVSKAARSQRLAIDYRITYARANGRTSEKVFKLAERTLEAGETIPLAIKQSFADLSTRRHYPGPHRLEIIVNGRVVGEVSFNLR